MTNKTRWEKRKVQQHSKVILSWGVGREEVVRKQFLNWCKSIWLNTTFKITAACANTFLPLQNFKWFSWNTWHLLHKFKKIKQHFRRKRKTAEFYIKICSMHHIIASKLTSRLLSSSTAMRSRANSFSDWAKTKAKRMTWSTSHFKIRWVHYLDWSSSDRYCSYKVLPQNQ